MKSPIFVVMWFLAAAKAWFANGKSPGHPASGRAVMKDADKEVCPLFNLLVVVCGLDVLVVLVGDCHIGSTYV